MSDDQEPTVRPDGAASDSDAEDEDYVPGADPNEPQDDDEHDAGAEAEEAPAALTITKRRAVDDAFYDLFGYRFDDETTSSPPGGGEKLSGKVPIAGKKRRANAALSKRHSVLASIFGRRATAKLVRRAKFSASIAAPKAASAGGMIRLERRVVSEVKRFAGQEIRVERVVTVPVMAGEGEEDGSSAAAGNPPAAAAAAPPASHPESTAAAAPAKPRGVDSLLDELSRPEKLSTISKTSADWDLFKSKNADASLKEQLEGRAAGNEAYLVKKDFLDRVDRRKFEMEKAQRDRERARRGK